MKTRVVLPLAGLCALACGRPLESSMPFASADGTGDHPATDGVGAGDGGQETHDGVDSTSITADGDDRDDDGEGPIYDVGSPDLPSDLDCDCGNFDWSYVFIANSAEGTVSKINTRTMQEEGRYLTRPDGQGNPSRTSVSIDGRAAVVANRHTGIVKIWARPEFCDDHNGTPGIQTSSGNGDVLPWGEDDCVAWYTPFADMSVQRPVQWTSGGACHADQKVWTVTGANGSSEGRCGAFGVWVHRLDGETGSVEDTIHLSEAEFPCDHTGTDLALGLGAYGGAVDANGNFYFHGWGTGKLARVDFDTLEPEIFDGGGYGITVDTKGRVWLTSSFKRFDYDTQTWASQAGSGSGGIGQDLQGRMWAAATDSVTWVDVETLAPGDTVALPGTGTVKGVSVDIDGFIWASRQGDPNAYKIDPETYEIDVFSGLDGPYTYSDMTGGALSNVTCNPEG